MPKKKSPVPNAKAESGGRRLARNGYTAVLLGLTEENREIIDRARGLAPRTAYILDRAIKAAKSELANITKI